LVSFIYQLQRIRVQLREQQPNPRPCKKQHLLTSFMNQKDIITLYVPLVLECAVRN